MSFSEPGKFFDSHPGDSFQGRPGDAFQGRPGDSFQGGTFKSRSAERSAESHARHERWKQEKAAKAAEEAYDKAATNMANMAKNNAEGFASLVGQFRTMMEMCYPDLVKLCNQQVRMDSSDLYPAVACLSENGPVWRRSIPNGNAAGEVLVWDEELVAWVPGEGGGINNMSWQAKVEGSGDDATITYRGGTVTFFGGGGDYSFDGDTYETDGDDAYCYLYWHAGYNNGEGVWDIYVENAYPEKSDMDDGDVFIPLWKYVDGVLTQETVGAIVIPAVKNVVDKTE